MYKLVGQQVHYLYSTLGCTCVYSQLMGVGLPNIISFVYTERTGTDEAISIV